VNDRGFAHSHKETEIQTHGQMKHLSNRGKKKSIERPRVVASEIGETNVHDNIRLV